MAADIYSSTTTGVQMHVEFLLQGYLGSAHWKVGDLSEKGSTQGFLALSVVKTQKGNLRI